MNESFFNSPRIQQLTTGVLAVLLLWLGAKFITEVKGFSYVGRDVPAMNVITVSGLGEVYAKADIASVSFSVSEEKKTVGEAQSIVTEKMDKALEAVKALGVEEKDIKTAGYNVYPQYEWIQATPCTQWSCPPGKNELKGYQVSQTIVVKVRDTDKLGTLLEGLGSAGITTINGPEFTIDDEDVLKAEAREIAIKEAKEKAEKLADDLGVRLVRISSFYENSDPGYPMPFYGMGGDMAMSARAEAVKSVPSVPVGENKIVSSVSITYEIR
jgi:uncharacterized protein YggE